MSVEITSINRTMLNRMLEAKFDKFVKAGQETRNNDKQFKNFTHLDDDVFYEICTKHLRFKMRYDAETRWHDDCCDEDGLNLASDDCDCNKETEYEIWIQVNESKGNRLFGLSWTDSNPHSLEMALEYFKTLPDILQVCPCGNLVTKDTWCDECYIKRIDHPTDLHCAICLENEGVYMKTDCNHYFHKHCWSKLPSSYHGHECKTACPMCKTISNYNHYWT